LRRGESEQGMGGMNMGNMGKGRKKEYETSGVKKM